MKLGVFSTDWNFEKVPDQEASEALGQTVFVKGKRLASFGGTYYYRMALPYIELEDHGYTPILSYSVQTAKDGHLRVMDTAGEWHDDCDVVVFQRWMHEDGADRALKARACGQVVINDLDDDFWNLPKSNVAADATDPKNSPHFNRDHYKRMLAASSAITVSTKVLADQMATLGVPVFMCRNAIDIDRWVPHDPGVDGMVGWVGGTPWRAHDLEMLAPVLTPFLAEHGIPFYHGGHSRNPGLEKYKDAREQLQLDRHGVNFVSHDLVNIVDYPVLWEPVNLAVIPLEDCRFNHAKSYLKGLEAAACGIPFIASNTYEYRLLDCGRLAKTPKQWRRHLDELLDPTVRRAEGAANRKRAEELSIHTMWKQWDDVLREVAPTTTPELVEAA